MTKIFLDLDGVMADFDGAFPKVFGLDHKGMADEAMWEKINGHPSFFRDLPPMPGALEFFERIKHLDPIILTACPKTNYKNAATQKIAWVREHLSKDVLVMPVMGGSNKPLFMHAEGDILIDDFERNCLAWAAHGGVPILHRNFEQTGATLEMLLAGDAFEPTAHHWKTAVAMLIDRVYNRRVAEIIEDHARRLVPAELAGKVRP